MNPKHGGSTIPAHVPLPGSPTLGTSGPEGMSRRALLTALAASSLLPSAARAFGDPTLLDVAELDLGPGTITRPEAWKRVLYDAAQLTSVETGSKSVRLTPEDPALFEHPFAVIQGTGRFAPLTDAAEDQLARYLSYGGFLLIDDTTGAAGGPFDRSIRDLIAKLFPTRSLAPVPAEHSLYRCFFLLRQAVGRLNTHGDLEAVTLGTWSPVVYCRNDVSGALDRTPDGQYRNACVPDGEGQRREAKKFAINLIMYSLTSNYKRDQAHVRQLIIENRLPDLGEDQGP
jgi:hypothetical protein